MSEHLQRSVARTKIDSYSTSAILAISSFFFLTLIPFLPGTPILQLLLSAGLGISALRRPVWAAGVLAILVFFSVLWQIVGFGLVGLIQTPYGQITFFLLVVFIGIDLASAHLQPTSMALALLAVALMLTPYYYLAIGAIVVAAAIGGLSSIGPVSITFVSTLTPLLILENAILYANSSPTTQTPPILFAQLTGLAHNLVPPLGGLNIFLTGLPSGGPSQYSGAFISFLSTTKGSVILIPLLILSVIFGSSASIAGIINSLFSRLVTLGRLPPALKVFSPFIASCATPIAFVYLITVLAASGGYQTSLANLDDSLSLIGGSVVLGLSFTGREFLLQRLERLEFAKRRLSELIATLTKSIDRMKRTVEEVRRLAPTVDVGGESKQLDEESSYIKDISEGVGTASYPSLEAWISDFGGRILPTLEKMPESIRIRLIDELNKLVALGGAYNAMLNEARVRERFPESEGITGALSHTEALSKYQQITGKIRDTTFNLYEEYGSAAGAFNILMSRELITPPVDPRNLIKSNDYAEAMKLMAEEYWLNFHIMYGQELDQKISSLLDEIKNLSRFADRSMQERLQQSTDSLSQSKPSTSASTLNTTRELLLLLQESLTRVQSESEQILRLVDTLTPGSTRIVRFEMLEQHDTIKQVQKKSKNLAPALDDVSNFVRDLATVLSKVEEAKNTDMRTIKILSHYNLAKKYIENLSQGKNTISLSELPFQHEAAVLYVKLIVSSTHAMRYDDVNEVIVVKYAQVC